MPIKYLNKIYVLDNKASWSNLKPDSVLLLPEARPDLTT